LPKIVARELAQTEVNGLQVSHVLHLNLRALKYLLAGLELALLQNRPMRKLLLRLANFCNRCIQGLNDRLIFLNLRGISSALQRTQRLVPLLLKFLPLLIERLKLLLRIVREVPRTGLGTAHIRKVSVTRDLGTQVEVGDGVKQGDQVIVNPPVSLVEGSKVRARAESATPRT
jgi:hypothetical protein